MSYRHGFPACSRRRELPRCTPPPEALAVRSRALFLLFARFFRYNIKRINPFRLVYHKDLYSKPALGTR